MIDELRRLITEHAVPGNTAIDGVYAIAATGPNAPRSSIVRPILAVIAQGSKRIVFGDQIYEYGAGDFLVVSMDVPVTGHYIDASPERPCLGVGLDLRPDAIASLLLRAAPERIRAAEWPAVGTTPLAARTALGRLGEPDDIGKVIAFLLSDDGAWITAQTIEASGGFGLCLGW